MSNEELKIQLGIDSCTTIRKGKRNESVHQW